jgi:DNA-binding NarL/FixJ family response regulator
MAQYNPDIGIRVAVVEENPVEREYLTALVDGAPGVEVSSAYSGLAGTMSLLEKDRPDLLLLDLDALTGFQTEWIRELHTKLPHTTMLVLSAEKDRKQIFQTLEAGVSGWLQKPCTADQIIRAILLVHEGGAVLSSPVARQILNYFHARGSSVDTLTPREREVLGHLSQGLLAADIAAKLGVSRETIRTHVRNILVKLKANSRAEAMAKYLNPGQITDH